MRFTRKISKCKAPPFQAVAGPARCLKIDLYASTIANLQSDPDLKVLPLQNENSYHLINFSCNVVCCVYTYS
nr:MAG TPA: hypothetical protein [Caudoviricetes sp.]